MKVPTIRAGRPTFLFAAALLMLAAGCMGPYTVTRELRGVGPQRVYYVYPPGSRPERQVRVVEPLADKPDAACAATIVKSSRFTLRFRLSAVRAPAIVVHDNGKLPASREKFDEDVSTLIKNAGACLSDEKAQLVTERLWERMPKTFYQDLYERYGFDAGDRRVDLQPGMRLRFDWQAYFAEPSGYIGGGTSFIMVGRRPHGLSPGLIQESGLLTFEPFLSWVEPGTVDRTANPQIAGAPDLEGNLLWRKHYRLYLPRSGFGKSSVASDKVRSRTLLVGVNAIADFAKVIDDLSNLCNKTPDDATKPICTSVAGRTLVVPEIPLYLRGSQAFLPLGTTLRHVIDRDARVWSPNASLPLQRFFRGRLTAVVFPSPDEGALDLPLVKGDRFSW